MATFTLAELVYGDKPFADVTLLCADRRELSSHAVILRARCPQLLEHSGKELVALHDSKVVEGLLHFVYTDHLPDNASEFCKSLQALAAQLRLQRLEMLCEESAQNHAIKNGATPIS